MQFLYKLYRKIYPLEMVSWWKHKEAVQAKHTTNDKGEYEMWMDGEKYPFPGIPRGHLLYGSLSPLKHQIKVQIFNDSWWRLEKGISENEVVKDIKGQILDNILELGEKSKYDMVPYQKMVPSMKEFHRAWTKCTNDPRLLKLRDILCYYFGEDDGYRYRLSWVLPLIKKKGWNKAFQMLEDAEVIDDMKERIRLVRRILGITIADNPTFWNNFLQELDMSEIKLTNADKYYFRAKYFKCDYKDPNTYWGRIQNEVNY